ncbi:MAG: DJ-1/PfpI family protein [Roseburia sp.]|nr:DJ-1/PfpI family protein [Roseburia sp.]
MIADGTEEVECLAVVDILRRADIDTVLVSADGLTVNGSHGIKIIADMLVGDVYFGDADLLFIPGGLQGSERLGACAPLKAGIRRVLDGGKRVAAICAAPAAALGAGGFLHGVKATCYPGHEARMTGCIYSEERVVTDGQITTARGMGCSVELGLELVRLLKGEREAAELGKKIIA